MQAADEQAIRRAFTDQCQALTEGRAEVLDMLLDDSFTAERSSGYQRHS